MTAQSISSNFTKQSKSKLAWIAIFALLLSTLAVISPSDNAFAAGSPTLTQVNPAAGPAGTAVTISGSNFSGIYSNPAVAGDTLKVSFRSSLGRVTAMSSTSITVTAPTGSAGLADITVETPDGILTIDDAFNYRAALTRPTVSSVSPSVSTLSANSEVAITGTGFVGVTSVTFGTTNAVSYRVESATRIVAVVPAKTVPGSSQVKVTTSAGTSTSALNLNYADPCEISNYANVRFAYRSSKLTKATRKVLRDAVTEMVSAECGSVALLRYNAKVKASTSASHKAYILLQRARAKAVGDLVTSQLAIAGSTAKVTFAKFDEQVSQAAFANWDSRKSYRRVTIANRASSVPAVTASYPNVGSTSGGTTVTIKGVNLSDITSVKFGSTTATFSEVGDDQINATAPAGTGVASITLSGPNGSVTKSGAFRYAAAATITSISSSSANVAGTATITINGTNFYGLRNIDSVRFGSVNASSFQVVSTTRITAVVPANTPGSQNISVLAAGGSDSESFSYRAAPSITSISPTSGSAGGGTTVTITGSGFENSDDDSVVSGVRFGTKNATSYNVVSSSSVTAVSPSETTGTTSNVTITTSGGQATLKAAYKFGGVITPATQTIQATKDVVITPSSAYSANGALTNPIAYTVTPTLPTGLTISGSTGVISGTPTVGQNATSYTVTATGDNDVLATAVVTISVASVSPASFTAITGINDGATAITPSAGFSGSTFTGITGTKSYTISPALPAGLSINSTTGVVSGTPTADHPTAVHTITVTGSTAGTATATISITVNPAP